MTTTRCLRTGAVTSDGAFMGWLLLSGDWVPYHRSRPDLQLSTFPGVIAHTRERRT